MVEHSPTTASGNRILGWNSWTEVNDLATARQEGSGGTGTRTHWL